MASGRGDELLRQIQANPDDLAIRGVYADELQAAGDPRGELVALELEATEPENPAHRARHAALVARHAATWWTKLARHRIHTRGGFLDRVACDTATLAAARDVFARELVRDVELVDAHVDTFPLSELAWQTHVTHFTARAWFANGLFALARASLGDRLVSLDVGASNLDRDIVPLGSALPACRTLGLAQNRYLGRHLPRLLDWRGLGALEVLDLSRTSVTPELLAELLALDLKSLRHLRLSGNPIGNLGPRLLVDALPRMPALARVDLFDCDLDEAGVAPLRETALAVIATEADVPTSLVLDLVNMRLELVRLGEDRWAVKVDGRQRTIRWHQIQRDDRREARESPWQMAEIAPLDRVAFAIASGAPRELTADGCELALRSQTGYVYNTSVYTAERVRIACTPAAATVAITFDEYTSID
jgi:uncharacterized protein (TIGR02996 family)